MTAPICSFAIEGSGPSRVSGAPLSRLRAAVLGRSRFTAFAAGLALTAGAPAGPAAGDELTVPAAVERNGTVEGVYRFDGPVRGRGDLDVLWTDVLGRIVERRRMPLDLEHASQAIIPLDLGRAVTQKNTLVARLSLDDSSAPHPKQEAAEFIVPPSSHPWSDFQIIMWQAQTRAGWAALRRLGITAGVVASDRKAVPGSYVTKQVDAMLDNDQRWYVENIGTDFYSPYHKWSLGRPPNWRFREVKRRYEADPTDATAFFRSPSLSDPEWLGEIRDRLIGTVRALHRYRPLYYSLADEPGIADLSAVWDFDLSAPSLAAMREWLKLRYGGLAQLNREWGTTFRRWDQVTPEKTSDAIRRSDENFAAWADFKEWMDVAFARAVAAGTAAIHAADPEALSAIEGAQIPGWGGYDYSRLAKSVDAMELYDHGNNVELLRSFNPAAVMLTTSFQGGASERHRVWRELLRGARGLILWDDGQEFVGKHGSLGPRGREAAPYFAEIRDGLGALLINSKRHLDPIAILYSPSSMRIEWLLERRSEGGDWTRRSASAEYEDTPIRVSTRNYVRAIEHMGLQQRFVSAREVEQGGLGNYRVLILPRTISLSLRAARQIRDFVARGGVVVSDGIPGEFDEHGHKLARPLLDKTAAAPAADAAKLGVGKGKFIYLTAPDPHDCSARRKLMDAFAAAAIRPPFLLAADDGAPIEDVETYSFENGGVRLLALLRDLSESPACAPPIGAAANGSETAVLTLPHPYEVYDLLARRALGRRSRVRVDVSSMEPVILAFTEKPLGALSIAGPSRGRAGRTATFLISPDGASAAATDVIHVEIADPAGKVVPYYSGNLLARGGAVPYPLPLAVNDKPGTWTIRARDRLGGADATARLLVEP
ncbi:MAG TPA: beta-galactosidase [Stellaceae bacterium]|nr:beta-galactosidase [Stellaceae bacterium]